MCEVYELPQDYLNEPDRFWEVMIDFWLAGDSLDFDEATNVVGVEPTEIRKKEDFKIPEFAERTWSYSHGYEKTQDIEEQFQQIYSLIYKRCPMIRNFCIRHHVEVGLCIVIKSIDDSLPVMVIPSYFSTMAAQLNADIHFDIYCCLGDEL